MESIPRASVPHSALCTDPKDTKTIGKVMKGQNYRRFPYSPPFRAAAPLALPPAPQQAPVATQAMAIVPIQAQRPYVQDRPYRPVTPYPPAILPPQPKITPVNQVTAKEVVEPEYEEMEGEEYQYIYPEYYVHDDEGPKPVYQVNAIGRGQAMNNFG